MRTTLALGLVLSACGTTAAPSGPNPFLGNDDNDGKEDSAYLNPDGTEVEVDLEGDVVASSANLPDGPAMLGQFATTYFRKRKVMYIESLAEDATAKDRVEWQIDGTWYTADKVPAGSTLSHWRMRGLDAVVLFEQTQKPALGQVFTATVPMKPFSLLDEAGAKCADDDSEISLDSTVYWYRWEPEKTGCTVAKQSLSVTVSKTFANMTGAVYPEFDKLVADGKLTVVLMFGEIDDGPITASEEGMQNFTRFAGWLADAGYKEVTAPLGKRYEKVVHGITVQIDLYSPKEFSGLEDEAHYANFEKAISEHEIVSWDGHSLLGGSDFWSRPTYPKSYQIFLYGGCLGYEYYVQQILHGKGDSWANLDLMSSVVEVSATSSEFAGPAIAKIVWALDHGYKASWASILSKVHQAVGDSTFGVSGVRDNAFQP